MNPITRTNVGAEDLQPCNKQLCHCEPFAKQSSIRTYSFLYAVAIKKIQGLSNQHVNLFRDEAQHTNKHWRKKLRKTAEKLRKSAETGGFENRPKLFTDKSSGGNSPKKTAGNTKKPPLAEIANRMSCRILTKECGSTSCWYSKCQQTNTGVI